MAKQKKRGGSREGAGRPRVVKPARPASALMRQVQTAYRDAGEPPYPQLAKDSGVSEDTLRRWLISGDVPLAIANLELVIEAMGFVLRVAPRS